MPWVLTLDGMKELKLFSLINKISPLLTWAVGIVFVFPGTFYDIIRIVCKILHNEERELMKKPWFKRWYVWVVALIFVAVIVGNNEKEVSNPAVDSTQVSTKASTEISSPPATQEASKEPTELETKESKVSEIFNIKDVALKSEDEVNQVLGAPSDTETGKWGLRGTGTGTDWDKVDYKMNYYKEDKIEIMFIEGKAVRIRLNLNENEYLKEDELKENLAYVGLPVVELDPPVNEVQKAFYVKNLEGIYQVQIGEWVGTKDGYVLVITEEKYS